MLATARPSCTLLLICTPIATTSNNYYQEYVVTSYW